MRDDVTSPESQVRTAREIAIRAHAGQVDKLGEPYIQHVSRVAAFVAGDPRAEATAWLHDVVEDTLLSTADLRGAGIAEDVIAAVAAITRRDDENEDAYLARVSANPLALKVKLEADLVDNTAPDRLARVPDDQRATLSEKYQRYRATLERNRSRSA